MLASVDGVIDESYYVAANASHQLDRNSGISTGAYLSWFNNGFEQLVAMASAIHASLAYYRDIWRGLTGVAAIGLDGDQPRQPSRLFCRIRPSGPALHI